VSARFLVVIPAYNEAESLPVLIERIDEVVAATGLSHEIWVIDDGSDGGTFAAVETLAAARPHVHGLCFCRNFGKAAALSAGFEAASAGIVITMDADLQDDPAEIPVLVASHRGGLGPGVGLEAGPQGQLHQEQHEQDLQLVHRSDVRAATCTTSTAA